MNVYVPWIKCPVCGGMTRSWNHLRACLIKESEGKPANEAEEAFDKLRRLALQEPTGKLPKESGQ